MSTSAVTALLDRLERGGFVERHRDPGDRRRVFVRSTGRHERELGEIYAPLGAATTKVLDGYSESHLRVIHGFLDRLAGSSREFIENLRHEQ